MEKAWELARIKTDSAIPTILKEEDQTWDANVVVGDAEDAHLRLLWNSNVPGSFAPESIMLAAIQAKENMGYIVENGVELWEKGQEAITNNDMIELNKISSQLWNAVNNAKKDESHKSHTYTYYENWEQYKKAVAFIGKKTVKKEELLSKLHSGWMAQIVGGALGTMIEGYTTKSIRERFGEVRDYLRAPNTFNDDITYELVFLDCYEKLGKDITSTDIALGWIGFVPAGWSAEELALRNIRWGVMPPMSGILGNPFGEWIGAQMRGAICGMVAPGDPEEAARLAFLDGQVSHYNNGIIGEMFNAMLVSMAFVQPDIRQNVKDCISMIPKDCEYYYVVSFALNACIEKNNWEEAWSLCEKEFYKYNWIHAYPNAAAQVIALWFGKGTFDETAYIIAMEGQDVDCNAAQILSAIGIMGTVSDIDTKFTDPIGDELHTYLRRDRQMSIKKLAERTLNAIRF